MAIHVHAYAPTNPDWEKRAQDERFFWENLCIVLDHCKDIVDCSEYFFCPLSFAFCSFLWLGNSGPLCLGHLLFGWNDGALTAPCSDCGGVILLSYVGGSPLSGSNSWSGFCVGGCGKKSGRQPESQQFRRRMDFALAVRRQLPQEISQWEDYDGTIFSWGGNGLQPARKKRLIVKPIVGPVLFEVLVEELRHGNIRKGNPPQSTGAQDGYEFELRSRNGSTLTFPSR
jgi:hypothetical protein